MEKPTKQMVTFLERLEEAAQASGEGKPVKAGRALQVAFDAIPAKRGAEQTRAFDLFTALERELQVKWEGP